MSKKPIKSNLFRFVTLRSPELIEDKEVGFVSFSEEKRAQSVYYQAINGIEDNEAREIALRSADEGIVFSPFDNRIDVKNSYPKLYAFSSWLMRNKASLSYASIQDNLNEAISLPENDANDFKLTKIWDNLFYQTIQKKSIHIREALIQLLIANQFLTEFENAAFPENEDGDTVFSEENKKEFIRRANASVIISKELLLSSKAKEVELGAGLSSAKANILQVNLEASLAQERIDKYQNALKEIQRDKSKYEKENQRLYKEALNAHNIAVEDAISDATPTLVDVTNPDTQVVSQIKTYPDLVLPKFDYTPLPMLPKVVDGNLQGIPLITEVYSQNTLSILGGEDFDFLTDFAEVEKAIASSIKEEQFLIEKANRINKPTTVSIGGTTVTSNPFEEVLQDLYCYTGNTRYLEPNNLLPSISMGLVVPDANTTRVVSASYSVKNTLTDTLVVSGVEVEQIPNFKGMLLIRFFKDGVAILPNNDYEFSGTLTLNNDVELSFLVDASQNIADTEGYFEGCCKVLNGGVNPIDPTSEAPALFGVTQLGIADFRRVEQEVCCYVPGEVSHIENIMAKEYKEKQTRLLNSSEQTTEQTSERETENLTDTSSTERNEMQSEASSVMNQDSAQSFGANAGVTASWGTGSFSAGTNFNSSSSNSSSISNSQAQTYAQEVTERALERVVQKISSKRSSRILREYEENNTHGFDNRKGSEHITGVYRWVDKIYKNTLVNYGKRLMYEFAIPEPAKYLKKALVIKSDGNETTDLGLVKLEEPGHPSTIDLVTGTIKNVLKASDLNEGNYQELAAKYNAEVLVVPVEEMYIGKAFSYKKVDNSDSGSYGERYGENTELDIPDGYYTTHASADWADSSDSGVANPTKIIVGNIKMVNGAASEDGVLSKFVSKIPISFSSYSRISGNSTVSIKLKRLDEALEKWQNETYKAILDAYAERVREYNDFILSQQVEVVSEEGGARLKFNPLFNRSMEKRELKRLSIELLTKSTNIAVSREGYQSAANGTFTIKAGATLDKHASVVKFFEQAFDWEIMAYTFYPYFYTDSAYWENLITDVDAADPVFQAFLQSGMARSVVPVRPGFEDAVNWYMATGEIWNGQSLVADVNDDLYVSVAEEMQTIEGVVEGEPWETRVPTSLTILQADSVVLKEGGSPCNTDCNEHSLFESSSLTIGDNPEGVDYDVVEATNNVV